jgi:4-amino-4-deoxy-L-arabinose transferase-like glycosyltransferase
VLRIIPLVPASGLSRSVSYDEGVYFSAAALVARGVVPYRDFVFIHPPGILIGLAPVVWLGHHFFAYDDHFLMLRAVAGLIGAVNVALVGRLTYRSGGLAAAVAAMLLYATFPPAVIDEGRLLLEPFMTFSACSPLPIGCQSMKTTHPG